MRASQSVIRGRAAAAALCGRQARHDDESGKECFLVLTMTITLSCVLLLVLCVAGSPEELPQVVVNATSDAPENATTVNGDVPQETPLCQDTAEFVCNASNICISKVAYCNGVWDCEDGSDELSCYFETCPRAQVLCQDKSKCVAPLKICDGKFDCRDHSDEIGCCKSTIH